MERRTHRSHISYIDKSREYYAAHGYTEAYAWPHYKQVPFVSLRKPLTECRVGIVTTADLGSSSAPRETKLFALGVESARDGLVTDKFWDRDATHTDDPETYLPITALKSWVSSARIASLSPRVYGVPTDYSQRQTLQHDAPQIAAWAQEDDVDAMLLVPL